MKRLRRLAARVAVLLALVLAGASQAQPLGPTQLSDVPWTPPEHDAPKVIYGADDRLDLYQVADPVLQSWAASTCALVQSSRLSLNPNGTYSLATAAYRVSGKEACADEPFGSQPTAAFCTGFLVGTDLIATAGHCYSTSNISGVRFLFGFQMLDANTPVTVFTSNHVYSGVEVVGRAYAGNLDYAVIRLDRPVTAPGAIPFAIRREGVVPIQANVGVIGHPAGLPMKIAFGANTRVSANGNSGYFVANLDTYGGNSGSPVINPATGLVEGILVRGAADYVIDGNCFRSNQLSDAASSEECSKSLTFAQFVPFFDPTAEVWVDFAYAGIQSGTQAQPFSTLASAVDAVSSDGMVRVLAGESPETPFITKPLHLSAEAGKVRIGVSAKVQTAGGGQKPEAETPGAAWTVEELAALLAAYFREVDRNGDGVLSEEEIRAFLEARRIVVTESLITALLALDIAPQSGPGGTPGGDTPPDPAPGEGAQDADANTRFPFGCRPFGENPGNLLENLLELLSLGLLGLLLSVWRRGSGNLP